MTAVPRLPEPVTAADPFVRRALVLGLIVVAAVALWRLRGVVTMAFGAILLAIALRTLADAARRRLGAPAPVALALAVGGVLGLLALAGWFAASTLAAHGHDLAGRLPQLLNAADGRLAALPQGPALVARLHQALADAPKLLAKIAGSAPAAFGAGVIVLIAAIFLAADPQRYRSGLVRLMPPARRGQVAYVLDRVGAQLRRWMAGKLITMTTSGVLCSLGLWALGVDAPFAVGLAGAVLCFVPSFGSIVAAALAMLVAGLKDPMLAVWVAGLYWGVHFIEGALIGPLIQDRAARVPPVFTLFAMLVFAILIGPPGVILAGPLTVLSMTLVQTLYLEGVLGEAAPAARARRRAILTPVPAVIAAE